MARLLQKRALAMQEASAAKRQHAKESDQAARKDCALVAQRTAETKVRHEELRQQNMRESERALRERAARAREMALCKAKDKWIQTQFPMELALRLRRHVTSASPKDKTDLSAMLRNMAKENWFRFLPRVPELWDAQPKWLCRYGEVKSFEGPGSRVVRCSAPFDCFLDEVYIRGVGELKKADQALHTLLHWVLPDSQRYVFQSTSRSFLRFLHLNDYILDKTFVHCVVCLSRWLTPANWPAGLFNWPPAIPPDVLAAAVTEEAEEEPGPVPALPPPLPPPGTLSPPLPQPPLVAAASASGASGSGGY